MHLNIVSFHLCIEVPLAYSVLLTFKQTHDYNVERPT